MTTKLKRDGEMYNVVAYYPETGDICVEDEFNFADPPYKRMLKMWWIVKDDDEIKGE